MKLRGPSELLDIAEFALNLLGVNYCDVTICYAKKDDETSECSVTEAGDFTISIERGLNDNDTLIKHVAHECVHLKQFKRDELVFGDNGIAFWNGKPHTVGEDHSDDYFLSPWEMEARALEDWILYRWTQR